MNYQLSIPYRISFEMRYVMPLEYQDRAASISHEALYIPKCRRVDEIPTYSAELRVYMRPCDPSTCGRRASPKRAEIFYRWQSDPESSRFDRCLKPRPKDRNSEVRCSR